MAVIIDGTNGITTPTGTGDVSVGDDLTFTGTGNRITGDFSTGTTANRVAFQTSTASGATIINVLPGSGAIGSVGHNYFNDPSANNCARFDVGILNAATEARLSSTIVGTGTFLPMTFLTGGSERARIDVSGNLLVGTTSAPNGASSHGSGFVVEGNDRRALYLASSTTGAGIGLVRFFNPNGTVGTITTGASSTSYNTSSDYRLKEDAQPVLNPINRLMQLKPINFAWKVDGSRVDGFLAHEAQAVVPEAITGTKDAVDAEGKPQYQGIDQSKLVPLLTAAIQEQQTLIQALTARIEALEVA